MKKDWILALGITTTTLVVAVGLIRWLAPGLLGTPTDLQLVQISKEVPPFFKGIFRHDDLVSKNYIIQDPITGTRAKPLLENLVGMGPNDILGFRNMAIPNHADIVVIGDSQTYGNNAPLGETWPIQMADNMPQKPINVYNMSVGGWGAVQYLDIFKYGTYLRPKTFIIAFYTGNDPLDSFNLTYGSDHWAHLRPDPNLKATDMPDIQFPPPKSDLWPVTFSDGTSTIFTPKLRGDANREHDPAVLAGYKIMAEVARQIDDICQSVNIDVYFTIIPTKEFVYQDKIRQDNMQTPNAYSELITAESGHIMRLEQALSEMGANYIDVVTPLREAALTKRLYPKDSNGHPIGSGYKVIGQKMASALSVNFQPIPMGLVYIQMNNGNRKPVLITKEGIWYFSDMAYIGGNGWTMSEDIPIVRAEKVASLLPKGVINAVDKQRFSPDVIFPNES